MERTSQQKGKRAEFFVFGELVRRGADLYLPVIDIGIDAIVRHKDGAYIEIQVKSTEKGWSFGVWGLDLLKSGERRFVVCVDIFKENTEGKPEVWVFPSNIFKEYANEIRAKENYRYYRLDLTAKSKKHGNRPRSDILHRYREAWELIIKGDTNQG